MKSSVNQLINQFQQLPAFHRNGIVSLALLLLLGILWPTSQTPLSTRIPAQVQPHHKQIPIQQPALTETNPTAENQASLEYQIQEGDTLSGLFERFNISQQTMYQVLDADLDILALDTLRPGNLLRFWLDNSDRQLNKLELYFNPARQVIFNRVDETNFTFDEINIAGEWKSIPITGEIHGSFYLSAQKAGLSAAEIQKIETLFQEKLNFSRDIRAGDSFQVLRNEQFIDSKKSGNSELLGIHLNRGKRKLNAYLFEDGSYYDKNGKSLTRAFTRYPVSKKYRISSHYNPNRKHPVTGLIRPHNGTDFATPVGTPVMATGDGVVKAIKNHRYAGKYVVIQHGGKYMTRYLHLSKILVRKGQRVSRGQRIGLSGATGRVTGPHLHYEFLINRRPVNPMKAKIPMASEVASKELPAYKKRVAAYSRKMQENKNIATQTS